MRAALLLAALALNTCTTANVAEKAESDSVKIQTIARGGYALEDDETGRKAVLARTDAEYRVQWQARIGGNEIPAVDFEKNVVVFLLAGMRNTGGWSVEPVSVRMESDGTAAIEAKVQGPPPGGITTQAITYPYAVVAVGNRDVKKVRWD